MELVTPSPKLPAFLPPIESIPVIRGWVIRVCRFDNYFHHRQFGPRGPRGGGWTGIINNQLFQRCWNGKYAKGPRPKPCIPNHVRHWNTSTVRVPKRSYTLGSVAKLVCRTFVIGKKWIQTKRGSTAAAATVASIKCNSLDRRSSQLYTCFVCHGLFHWLPQQQQPLSRGQ